MTGLLYAREVRIFDYPQFAATLRDRVREQAASLAAQAGVSIEHIAKSHIRKEAVVAKVIESRGDHPGLVHVISAMEACDAYKPWHDKQTHKTYIRADSGKCLHYYFYFMDDELGLIYLRVPTWAPFRLQFYCNGHSWLARRLTAEGIGFTAADNAFVRIDDWARAQELSDGFSPDRLHRVLDHYAALCCPVLDVFGQSYHWSLMQVEYATDLVFRSTATLGPLYEQLIRESVLSVKAEQIATFLGRQITPQLAQELGSQFSTRIEGTCIKHRFGQRLDQNVGQVRLHPAHRDHDQRRLLFQAPPEGGTSAGTRHARPRPRQENHLQPDRSARDAVRLQSPLSGTPLRPRRLLRRCPGPRQDHQIALGIEGKTVKGVNFFDPIDKSLLHALQNPRVNIAGFRRATTSDRSSTGSPQPVFPGNAACATSVPLNASPEPTDTISPASVAPLSPPSAASLRASSSRPSLDRNLLRKRPRTSDRSSTGSPQPVFPGNYAACATSVPLNASPEPIDIISPASAAPPPQRFAASPNASSSRPSLDRNLLRKRQESGDKRLMQPLRQLLDGLVDQAGAALRVQR